MDFSEDVNMYAAYRQLFNKSVLQKVICKEFGGSMETLELTRIRIETNATPGSRTSDVHSFF